MKWLSGLSRFEKAALVAALVIAAVLIYRNRTMYHEYQGAPGTPRPPSTY